MDVRSSLQAFPLDETICQLQHIHFAQNDLADMSMQIAILKRQAILCIVLVKMFSGWFLDIFNSQIQSENDYEFT